MPPASKLCIVVADGGHARFVRAAADNALHTSEAIDSAALHARDHDLVSDRPGRAFESGSSARHAYTPRHDPHEQAKDEFTREVAKRINEAAAAGTIDDLFLVAPAHVLSQLTDAIDAQTKVKLSGTLAKDLVKIPDHELWPHLKAWVRPVRRA